MSEQPWIEIDPAECAKMTDEELKAWLLQQFKPEEKVEA